MEDIFENQEGRRCGEVPSGGVDCRSMELLRLNLECEVGMGLAAVAPAFGTVPLLVGDSGGGLGDFRCAETAVVVDVAVVVVGGRGVPMGWRGWADTRGVVFVLIEVEVDDFAALSVAGSHVNDDLQETDTNISGCKRPDDSDGLEGEQGVENVEMEEH